MLNPSFLAMCLALAGSIASMPQTFAEDLVCLDGQEAVSVEHAVGSYCTYGNPDICHAQVSTGACPAASEPNLPYGSYCGIVATDVYGCKTTPKPTPEPTTVETTTPEPTFGETLDIECSLGDSEISVQGVEGIFCVTPNPNICVGPIGDGACPGSDTENGLPFGSYCGTVTEDGDVYGCKVIHDPSSVHPTMAPTPEPTLSSATNSCGDGESEVSVQGVNGIFCITGSVCSGNDDSGACPASQDGLENGSECDLVALNVYGCKETGSPPFVVDEDQVFTCDENEFGDTLVSVVGQETYCAPYPVCVNQETGNCPETQPGLNQDSSCAIIATGVYGCVLMV